MQPPILPIQHSDVQWATYVATVQTQTSGSAPDSAPPATSSSSSLLLSSVIVLLFLAAFGAIVYKKQRADALYQQIRRLERLWQFESYSPFEERR